MKQSNVSPDSDQLLPADSSTGIQLLQNLTGHLASVYHLQFSPDGTTLLSTSADKTIQLHDYPAGNLQKTLTGHTESVVCAAWSPDSKQIVSCSRDKTIKLWDVETAAVVWSVDSDEVPAELAWSPDGEFIVAAVNNNLWLLKPLSKTVEHKLEGHEGQVRCLAWSPDGKWLAAAGEERTIYLWEAKRWLPVHIMAGHTQTIYTLTWSPDGKWLVSGSGDKTIRIWDVALAAQKMMIDSHTNSVIAASFSANGQLLASKSVDNTVRIWRTATWQAVAHIDEPCTLADAYHQSIVFHPTDMKLATHDETNHSIRIYHIDESSPITQNAKTPTFHYTNAKVVLLGDTGVGKSALSLVLCGQPYRDTDSTHSRQVHTFDTTCIEVDDNVQEIRETLLWDLAGQPGYRLIHQLHLRDVSVALIVYDSRNEIDPFAGVIYWVKALQQSRNLEADRAIPLKIFLVAARVDRGKVGVGRERIEKFMQAHGIAGYFETSARMGKGVAEMAQALRAAIDWNILPKISSTELLQKIKDFCLEKRNKGLFLISQDNLYVDFLGWQHLEPSPQLRAQFDTCVSLLAAQGVFESFSFGNLLLLKSELLDSYASGLINAARNEPDGLGFIPEENVLEGNFDLEKEERIPAKAEEKLLLIATVEKLLRHEIALRVHVDSGAYLVFPSQFTREQPDLKTPAGKIVKFTFEGPVLNIWATLVVRLAQSGLFQLRDMWKNGVMFSTTVKNASCGLLLREITESKAELILFYDTLASDYTRYQFEEYIYLHLQRRTLPDALKRVISLNCHACGYEISEQVIDLRRKRGFSWVACPVCSTRLYFTAPGKGDTKLLQSEWILQMDKTANRQRDKSVAAATVNGKRETGDYDVFLCYNHRDKNVVLKIGEKLKEHGLLPWLDEWELRPGIPWQTILEQKIQSVKAAAVFVGPSGIGPWQDMEQMGFLREFNRRGCPVIPVVLPNCKNTPELPLFLSAMTWVDFRKTTPNPLRQLIWGITGDRTGKEAGRSSAATD